MAQTNCLLSAGYTLGCLDNAGGVKKVWIGNWSSDIAYTKDSDNIITVITSGNTLYGFEVTRETCGVNENITVSVENGSVFYEQNLSLVFNKMDADIRNQILLLAKATTTAIVQDANDNYWLVGEDQGLNVNSGTAGTGLLLGDRNGYSLTLQGKESQSISKINYSAFTSYIG